MSYASYFKGAHSQTHRKMNQVSRCANESIKGATCSGVTPTKGHRLFTPILSGSTNAGDYRDLGFLRRECRRWVSKRRGVVGGDRNLRLFDISPLASKFPPYGLRDLRRSHPDLFFIKEEEKGHRLGLLLLTYFTSSLGQHFIAA